MDARPAQEFVAQLLDPVLAAGEEPERPLADPVQRFGVARRRPGRSAIGRAATGQAAGPPPA